MRVTTPQGPLTTRPAARAVSGSRSGRTSRRALSGRRATTAGASRQARARSRTSSERSAERVSLSAPSRRPCMRRVHRGGRVTSPSRGGEQVEALHRAPLDEGGVRLDEHRHVVRQVLRGGAGAGPAHPALAQVHEREDRVSGPHHSKCSTFVHRVRRRQSVSHAAAACGPRCTRTSRASASTSTGATSSTRTTSGLGGTGAGEASASRRRATWAARSAGHEGLAGDEAHLQGREGPGERGAGGAPGAQRRRARGHRR